MIGKGTVFLAPNTLIFGFLIVFFASFSLTYLATHYLIPLLRRKKLGQSILEIGPHWHKSKAGTPTMGGILFLPIFALLFLIAPLFRSVDFDLPLLFTALYALLNGAIGIVDDLTKFAHHKNEGLSVLQKFSLQLLLAILYLVALTKCDALHTDLSLGLGLPDLSLGIFFYPVALILLLGTVNSLNLTDGLDGLASSVSSIIFAFFLLMASALSLSSLFFCATCLLGITLAFLAFNRHPAKIFMGDTGSLFFGGAICGIAFYLDAPLLLLPMAIFPLWEAVSVILQVGYYKLTHRRLFLMAPFHHHLERRGHTENKIVFFASFVTFLGCMLAYLWVRYGGIV